LKKPSFQPAALVLFGAAIAPVVAHAQTPYPTRPVRVIVPLATGSASDALARTVALRLGELWKQQVVIDNMPGSNGIIGATAITRAVPDGYTLGVFASNHVINASLYSKLPYDPIKDFSPIAQLGWTALVQTIHPSIPARDVKEFVAFLKARPGQINYASPGQGSPTHLAYELFKSMTGTNLVHVPYKAVSQAQTDLIAGQIPTMFMVPVVAGPQHKAGRLRALAVGSLRRVSTMPDTPTLDESGLKGFEVVAWVTLAGPAGLPQELVNRVTADVKRVLAQPETVERIRGLGLEEDYKSPAELRDFLPKDLARMAEIVRISGAKLE
jgi:tripartite-type tricarboxylate transporter receptor subunit TctC